MSYQVFMQANIDSDKALMARWNWRWNSALVTKTTAQIAPGAMGGGLFQFENDYTGADFTASIKANNPSVLEGGLTGSVVGDYLQSITPRLSLGLNAHWQREAMNKVPDIMLTYAARYKGDDWIGSARVVPLVGLLQVSYWRRIADKIDAGVNLELSMIGGGGPMGGMMGGAPRPEGAATIGAKYEFRGATYRAQVDSNGRLGCMLEKRVAPPVSITFVGQLDHVKVRTVDSATSIITNESRTKQKSALLCRLSL
jgi:mitochondrial import receptor subunit TOM40